MPTDDDMVDFHGFQNPRVLFLSYGGLNSQVLGWLSNLKNLEIMYLGHNQITGSIPSWLGTLPKHFCVDLAFNQISGEFLKQLCRLPMLIMNTTQVQNYEFELPLIGGLIKNPSFMVRRLSNLQRMINLRGNNINGSIPTEIGQLEFLHELYLDDNNFSGDIPNQISNLKYLEILNLFTNHFFWKNPCQ